MKPSVLYLSYTGLLEPLGRSQVLAYLKRLSAEHHITLLTFEKPADLADTAAMQTMRDECHEHGIDWIPKRYHHRPRLLATLYDVATLTAFAAERGWRGKVQLVHCRGYVAALGAWLAGHLTKVPFVFDMRALWIDEMILAGQLRERSLLELALRRVERSLLHGAASVVSLTQAAVDDLKRHDPALGSQRFEVIPTCVELDRFSGAASTTESVTPPVLGSVGTLASGWVPIDVLLGLYRELCAVAPEARLRVLTRDDPTLVFDEVKRQDVPPAGISVLACEPAEVPAAMVGMTAGFCVFYGESRGKLGSMPTRFAEFLAAGIPVVSNAGVGDVADLIRRYGVGVVLEGMEGADLQRAVVELMALRSDPKLGDRCRAAAEEYFSVERGTRAYSQLWLRLAALPREGNETWRSP